MSNEILKKPYEISLWEDIYDGQQKLLKERKVVVIGSSSMDSPTRAISPVLTQNINGSNTFTFSLYTTYEDEITGERVKNPFTDLIKNESKIKLKYDSEWYDFIVKSSRESSDNKSISYSLVDCFINELGKTGFNVRFDSELMNNTGTVIDLASRAVENTDWRVDSENSDKIRDYKEETLFMINYNVAQSYVMEPLIGTQTKTLVQGNIIYFFYSDIVSGSTNPQVMFGDSGTFLKDFNGTIIDDNYTFPENLTITLSPNLVVIGANSFVPTLVSDTRGLRLIKQQKSVYDSITKKSVLIYKDGSDNDVYGYYTFVPKDDSVVITNYIAESKDFTTHSTYTGLNGTTIQLHSNLDNSDTISGGYDVQSSLEIKPLSTTKPILYQSGVYDFTYKYKDIMMGEKWACKLDLRDVNFGSLSPYPSNLKVKIGFYSDIESGIQSNDDLIFEFTITNNGIFYCDALRGASYSELTAADKRIGLFIECGSTNTFYIKEFQLYKAISDGSSYYDPDTLVTKPQTGEYVYYTPNPDAADESEIVYLYRGETPSNSYTPYYDPDLQKISSITASESNCFNIIQSLAEKFKCWAKFTVYHRDNGEIETETIDGITRYKKIITFHEYIGKDNYAGFRYGINLKSIERNIDSNQLVTDLIVKPNSNQYADGYSCAIGKSKYNPSGEDRIINLNYYVGIGMLDGNTVTNDLYGANGYLTRLSRINEEESRPAEELTARLSTTISELESIQKTYQLLYENGLKDLNEYESELYSRTGLHYRELYSEIQQTNPVYETYYQNVIQGELNIYTYYKVNNILVSSIFWKDGDNWEPCDPDDFDAPIADEGEFIINCINQSWNDKELKIVIYYPITNETELSNRGHSLKSNSGVKDYMTRVAKLKTDIPKYKKIYDDATLELNGDGTPSNKGYYVEYDEAKQLLKEANNEKTAVKKEMRIKYGRYLLEGTWTSEDYMDPDLYYMDALDISNTSATPQITYTINVIELSQLEGFEPYTFARGDRTYVEDKEFFGVDLATGKPRQHDVVVSEVTYYLDQPENNIIKVQTYKTQFEGLFQRITAATTSLQYNQGTYNRAAAIIEPDKTIDTSILQDSLNKNSLIVKNAQNESVEMGPEGITIINEISPNNILRLTSGGVFLTQDGGDNYFQAITSNGINAQYIVTGQLDTSKILVGDLNNPSFRWDKDGLNAFKQQNESGDNIGAYDYGTYVRFDQYGIYGIKNLVDFHPTTINDIKASSNSVFGLTWNGFFFKGETGSTETTIDDSGISIKKGTNTLFGIDSSGNLEVSGSGKFAGEITATSGTFNNVSFESGTISSGVVFGDDSIGSINVDNHTLTLSSKYQEGGYDYEAKIKLDSGRTSALESSIEISSIFTNIESENATLIKGNFVNILSTGTSNSVSINYIEQNNNTIYIGTNTSTTGYLGGTWTGSVSSGTSSDQNKKHLIINIKPEYSTFFDNLIPRLYKYNDGTSDRYHTGFIAQEVKSALDTAGIDTKDFAGYVNIDNSLYLRYEEFIALNTLEIQKLKSRVSELENEIELLKNS